MRVEVKTQNGVTRTSAVDGTSRTNTEYQVVLSERGQDVVVDRYLTPGSFTDGFLSDHQARVRARDSAEALKKFFTGAGQLEPEGQADRPSPRPSRAKRQEPISEERSFAPRRA